jgi:hypothetical protein
MTETRQVRICGWLLTLVSLVLLGGVLGAATHAHGQASQPASAPVVVWWAWVVAHKLAILGATLALLPTVITAVTKYAPTATGLVSFLKIVLDVVSLLGHRDSPTLLNVPWRRSAAPLAERR